MFNCVYNIEAAPTIDYILRYMQEKYSSDIPTTFAFIWANKNFPQAGKELLNNSEYIHLRSNGYIDFFFPGYRIKLDIDIDNKFDISTSWEFTPSDFILAIEHIEKISKWKYSGNSELLILEYFHETIQFKNSIALNLDYLVKQNIIDSPSALMEDIIRIAKSSNRVSDFSNELNYLEAKNSFINAIKQYLSKKIGGVRTGAFMCRNLEIK